MVATTSQLTCLAPLSAAGKVVVLRPTGCQREMPLPFHPHLEGTFLVAANPRQEEVCFKLLRQGSLRSDGGNGTIWS